MVLKGENVENVLKEYACVKATVGLGWLWLLEIKNRIIFAFFLATESWKESIIHHITLILNRESKKRPSDSSYYSRHRWKMASHALMWERKALPSPCPSEAPFTRPAMSVTLRNAGTLLKEIQGIESNYCIYHFRSDSIQGEPSGCSLGFVNIKAGVAF